MCSSITEDRHNPNSLHAHHAERTRALWKSQRRDHAAFLSLQALSGFAADPLPPAARELDDL